MSVLSIISSAASLLASLVSGGFKWAVAQFQAKNTEAMQASANSAAAQRNKDRATRVVAEVEKAVELANSDAPLTTEQTDAMSDKTENDGTLDAVRKLVSGGNGK
jgi:hypothetical protein